MRGKFKTVAVCAAAIVGFTVMASEKPPAEYQTAMKNNGAANMALRGNIAAKDYARSKRMRRRSKHRLQ